MADLLTKSAKEIRDRVNELEPIVAEHRRLTEALAALEGVIGKDGTSRSPQRRSGRPRSARSGDENATPSPRGRRRQTRVERFVALVEKHPGITVADAARRLRTTPNSLYQITAALQRDGLVLKDGRGFHPAS